MCGTQNNPNGWGDECEQKVRRWTCTRKEKLVSFKYKNIDTFRDINTWAGSIRPHTVDIIYGNVHSGGVFSEKHQWFPKRSDLRDYKVSGSTTRTYTVNQVLHYWDYQEQGNRWKFYWNAEGSGNPVEISLGLSSTIKAKLSELFEVNTTRSFSIKKTLKNGSQKIEERVVDYCDQQDEVNGVHLIEGSVLHFSLATD